ncbi:MAG: UDP-4-amino-4,6-dideoxy-N-acetyl-beta-L-altrosamine transaminase [bacterium]|nr:UDP-4-amino-4,6-dideoxy-N-acetyl-beta-L-altrosamine transaminase [bacterium]
MIPYGHQFIDKKDMSEVAKVLKSDWLTQGPKVLEFEKALAKYCGAKYAVAVSSGTASLHLAYFAAGLKKGDEVITTANTFVATANMLIILGVKPVFCDIRIDSYNIDEDEIEKLITRKTKAIVPVHFSGQPCEMDKIIKVAKKYKLMVIDDACHALGARYKNKKIGSLNTDMSVFSFHPVKSITTGEGGAILTNNKKYYDKLKLLRSHGIYKDKKGKNVMIEMGFNYRLTDIQAALGVNQLSKINKFIKQRHKVFKWYGKELAGTREIILPLELKNDYSSCHIYVIRAVDPEDRDKLAAYLNSQGVGVNFHYPAVYSHPYYRNNGYQNVKLINEEIYQSSCLTLPCYPGLTIAQVKFITGLIKKYFLAGAERNGYKIIGQQVYLRKLNLNDTSQNYCDWLNDKEVNKYLETKNCTLVGLRDYLARNSKNSQIFFMGIFDKKSHRHIGTVKIEPVEGHKQEARFGMLIGDRNYWGRGIGFETTKLSLEYVFKKLGINKIILSVYPGNKPAIRIYKKIGFQTGGFNKNKQLIEMSISKSRYGL